MESEAPVLGFLLHSGRMIYVWWHQEGQTVVGRGQMAFASILLCLGRAMAANNVLYTLVFFMV